MAFGEPHRRKGHPESYRFGCLLSGSRAAVAPRSVTITIVIGRYDDRPMPHPGPQALDLICRPERWMRQAHLSRQVRGDVLRDQDRHRRGKALCDGCPCLASCLDYALRFGPGLQGVWRGLDRQKRARLLRRRQPA
jgi:hypothetical protein